MGIEKFAKPKFYSFTHKHSEFISLLSRLEIIGPEKAWI